MRFEDFFIVFPIEIAGAARVGVPELPNLIFESGILLFGALQIGDGTGVRHGFALKPDGNTR
jgi:hypothetical protein